MMQLQILNSKHRGDKAQTEKTNFQSEGYSFIPEPTCHGRSLRKEFRTIVDDYNHIKIRNMQKRIKFFTYHGCNDPEKYRFNSPASDTKVDYIVSVLNRCGYAVDQISHASSSTSKYLSGYVEEQGANTLRYFASLGRMEHKLWIFNMWFMNIQFFFWCLFNIKKGEQIIVYHSLGYTRTFTFLHKIRNIRIIGEIEEIFQDVHHQRKHRAKNEYKFIGICDKYLFPTSLLDKKLNSTHKPAVVVHGLYSVEQNLLPKFEDGKIHVVYGGTLDPAKGGGAAAAAAPNLPKNYHIHICGFGDPREIIQIVNEVSSRSKATLTFEGELKGKAYTEFIQRCHIGLSTQDPKAAFNSTSFPSKILVYLSNGLKVVSIKIPAIFESSVSNSIYFYENQTAGEIAQAILECSKVEINGQSVLRSLDEDFLSKLKTLIEE